MTDMQRKALELVIRAAMVWLAAKINAGKIIPPDLLGGVIDDFVREILTGLLTGGALFWSYIDKKLQDRKLAVALVLPPASSKEDVEKVMKATSPGTVPTPQEAAAIVTGRPQG